MLGRVVQRSRGWALGLVLAPLLSCAATRSLAQAQVRMPRGIERACFEASLRDEPDVLELRETLRGGRVAFTFELADPQLTALGMPSFSVSQKLVRDEVWDLVVVTSHRVPPDAEGSWREVAIRRQQAILRHLVERCMGAEVLFDRVEECSAESQYVLTAGRTQTSCVQGRVRVE